MHTYKDNESILHKEIRFMRLPFKGLSYYTMGIVAPITQPADNPPKAKLPPHMHFTQLDKSYQNQLLIVALKLLQFAYQEPSQLTLRRVKQLTYNETMVLTPFNLPGETQINNDQQIRKLFVEFFHLAACDKQPNKLEVLVGKYEIIKKSIVLLMRAILHSKGVREYLEVSMDSIVGTICSSFEVAYSKQAEGVYRFTEDHVVIIEGQKVYKSSQRQEHFQESEHNLLSSDDSVRESINLNQQQSIISPDYSIIKKLEQIEEEEMEEQRVSLQRQMKQIYEIKVSGIKQNTNNYNQTTPRAMENRVSQNNTPSKQTISKYIFRSPVSINKPMATHSSSKTPTKKTAERVIQKNKTHIQLRQHLKPLNPDNYSFGMEKPRRVIAPLKQMFGVSTPQQQKPKKHEIRPHTSNLTFRSLLGKML